MNIARIAKIIIGVMLIMTGTFFVVQAQVPKKINYQGYLEQSGVPINGTKTIKFSLYDAAVGGNQVWTETKPVTVTNGNFNTLLGEAVPIDLLSAKSYWLEIQIDSDPALTPRKELASAMYSLFVDGITINDSNVGIGTTTPIAPLQVVDSGVDWAARFDNINGNVNLAYKDGNGMHIGMKPDAPGNPYLLQLNVGRPVFQINKDGNVGIGTPSPIAPLQVVDSGVDWAARFNNANGDVRLAYKDGSGIYVAVDPNIPGNPYLLQLNAGRPVLHVNKNGNVGIGTNNPTAPLQVIGTGENWTGSFNNTHGDVRLAYKNGNGIYVYTNPEAPGNPYLLQLNVGSMTVLQANKNGNIGIGTSHPDARLTVAGKIHAREVKITSSAGADFVFEDDYKLQSLQEVERFIKANKHLPEIPSATEMQSNGLDMGEFQIKLLQKVEELTLHLIEQDKKLGALQQENEMLKQYVFELEKAALKK